jgi:hypothetical protein
VAPKEKILIYSPIYGVFKNKPGAAYEAIPKYEFNNHFFHLRIQN